MFDILDRELYRYNTKIGKIGFVVCLRKIADKEYFTAYVFLDKKIFSKEFIDTNIDNFPFFGGCTFLDEHNKTYEIGFDTYHYKGEELFQTFEDVKEHIEYVIDYIVDKLKENEKWGIC